MAEKEKPPKANRLEKAVGGLQLVPLDVGQSYKACTEIEAKKELPNAKKAASKVADAASMAKVKISSCEAEENLPLEKKARADGLTRAYVCVPLGHYL